MTTHRPIHGKLLVATGVLHTLTGLSPWVYGREWLAFAREGFVNVLRHPFGVAPDLDYPREAAFWFVIVGPLLMLLGDLVHHVERRLGAIPARFAWTLLAIMVAGALMVPVSGFPVLGVPQALFLVLRGASLAKARHAPA